jgi:4-azaleucine resistance transporter AzlC
MSDLRQMPGEADQRREIARQAISIGLAVSPFGLAFGAACAAADLSWMVASGFSVLVFTGGSQFAAVSVLSAAGRPITAVTAGLLLALRSLAYGVVMAPVMVGSKLKRALLSQLMIDEAIAVASTSTDPALQRYGYRWGGGSVFVFWNVSSLLGAILLRDADSFISTWGLDATIPASFLALVWPRLRNPTERLTTIVGAAIAAASISFLPAGMPIIAAGLAVFLVRASTSATTSTSTSTTATATSTTATATSTNVPVSDPEALP